jgi:hypothetical protein
VAAAGVRLHGNLGMGLLKTLSQERFIERQADTWD